jgi:hypothetical protein
MIRRVAPILLGTCLYVGLTFALYVLEQFAFPIATGPYPAWYANSQTLLKAGGAVGPGFVAAWLYARAGFRVGASTGVLGVLVEFIIAVVAFDVPVGEFPGPIASGLIVSAVAAGLTNGVAGMAAESLRARRS